jgi:hypothetical protein
MAELLAETCGWSYYSESTSIIKLHLLAINTFLLLINARNMEHVKIFRQFTRLKDWTWTSFEKSKKGDS